MLAELHSRHCRCSGSRLVRRTDRFELEFKADTYLTRRTPSTTVEGIRISQRAAALSYEPRPIEPVRKRRFLQGVPASKVLKHA
jgi:hypothetical protein